MIKPKATILWWPERSVACVVTSGDYQDPFWSVNFDPPPVRVTKSGEYGKSYLWFEALPKPTKTVLVAMGEVTGYSLRRTDLGLPESITPEIYESLNEALQELYKAVRTEDVHEERAVEHVVSELHSEPAPLDEGWRSVLPHAAIIDPTSWGSGPVMMPERDVFHHLLVVARMLAEKKQLDITDHASIGGIHIFREINGAKVEVLTVCLPDFDRRYHHKNALRVVDLYAKNQEEGRAKLRALAQRVMEVPMVHECQACRGRGHLVVDEVALARSIGAEIPEVTYDLPIRDVIPTEYKVDRYKGEYRWRAANTELGVIVSRWAPELREVIADIWRHKHTGAFLLHPQPVKKKR